MAIVKWSREDIIESNLPKRLTEIRADIEKLLEACRNPDHADAMVDIWSRINQAFEILNAVHADITRRFELDSREDSQ